MQSVLDENDTDYKTVILTLFVCDFRNARVYYNYVEACRERGRETCGERGVWVG